MPEISPLWILPFATLLLGIAFLPLLSTHFWEKNKNKAIISLLLSLPVILWTTHHQPQSLTHALSEYFSFVVLLGSLFVISGGIILRGDLRATPWVNTTFLLVGALLANIFGTTGASMLLIRPLLNTNSERKNTSHLVVFFIFIVSNAGGMLTPIGDPPLFLGYLRGVPFFWTFQYLWPIWLTVNTILLMTFFAWDSVAYKKEVLEVKMLDVAHIQPLRLDGGTNLILLLGIVGSVFIPNPWREMVMIALAGLSLIKTPKKIREDNSFSFGPINEVAILFFGIFVTMIPALEYLNLHATQFGLTDPAHLFWATGLLSSILDNAPTYLTFLSVSQGLGLPLPEVIGVTHKILAAISAGAVLMGANTYIGNGPNFMVKAVADHAGVKTPGFFGYMAYSGLILIPIFIGLTFIFFV